MTEHNNTHNNSQQESAANVSRRNWLKGAGLVAGAGLIGAANANESSDKASAADKPFSGKTAFVTGGARGIGLACAELFAAKGANVTLFDIAEQTAHIPYPLATQQDLDTAKAKLEKYGVKALAVKGDVRDRKALDQAMSDTVKAFGSLDFLVVNAGVTQPGLLETLKDEAVQTVMDINLGGSMKTIQAATPIMQKQKSGKIVLMSSVTGRAGTDMFPVYSATKWAMIGLAKTTALALGKYNVTSNAVCPVLVKTPLLDNDYVLKTMGVPNFAAFEQMAKSMDPMGVGFCDPEVIAKTVGFICSDDAPITSGDVFDVGGGLNARWPA